MAKAGLFVLLTLLACLAGGLFGALHDQVSYSVSPDYYHRFKFIQFAIPAEWPPRLGAAMVGFLASWWMGLVVGLPVFGVGAVLVKRPRAYWRAGIWGVGLVVALTAGASALGLLLELIWPTPPGGWRVPDGADVAAFHRAGAMHNAAYLGGALGLAVAFWPMIRARHA